MDKTYWGYHLTVDAANPKLEWIQDGHRIAEFAKELVKRINMVAYGDPVVVSFGSGNKAGYTLVQLIETRNICAHFVEDDGLGGTAFYLDVFSCKTFDEQAVLDCCHEYFGDTRDTTQYFTRQA
jgi:hypothetical protein